MKKQEIYMNGDKEHRIGVMEFGVKEFGVKENIEHRTIEQSNTEVNDE